MKDKRISILLIEDSPADALLIRELLAGNESPIFQIEHTDNLSTGLSIAIENDIDVLLLDLGLPDSWGLDTIKTVNIKAPELPIVVLTGTDDEQIGMKAVQLGAQDYLTKGKVNGDTLSRSLRYAIERKNAKVNLEKTLLQLKKSYEDMLSVFNQLQLITVVVDKEGYVTFLSQTGLHLFGITSPDVSGLRWKKLLALKKKDSRMLEAMSEKPADQRARVPVNIEVPGGANYRMDIEIQDDPRNSRGRIFFLYDITEVYNLRRQLDEKVQFHDLVGKSEPMRHIYQQILDVAGVDWTVLIEGKTGTGKELVARAIHFSSQRKDKPFIAVNCAGLADSLLSSLLFGHKKGAFTGAVEDHKGFFEAADGGTLFLDEIGDVSLGLQAHLLRALEAGEITRVGESRSRKVDVRILAATNRNLNEESENGSFRSDLLYRIRVARIQLPALRERREDIPLLVDSFLTQCRAATGKTVQEIGNETMRLLLEYAWPGNVRELRSAIEYAVIHCKGAVIQPEDLPPEIKFFHETVSPARRKPEDERETILAAMESTNGNRAAAARLLSISRATLYRRLKQLNITL